MSQAYSTFIFDFDGTLADSLNHVVPLYNSIADHFGVPQVTATDVAQLRRMSTKEALDAYGVPLWKLPGIVRAVRARLRTQIDQLQPFAGIAETLATLKRAGTQCLLLSSNSRDNIETFLTHHRLNLFEHLTCGTSLFGKATRLRKLLAHASLMAANAVYIGDEVRDIEAAKAVGVSSIAVSWGYGERGTLLAAQPDHLIDQPQQLLQLALHG